MADMSKADRIAIARAHTDQGLAELDEALADVPYRDLVGLLKQFNADPHAAVDAHHLVLKALLGSAIAAYGERRVARKFENLEGDKIG